MKGRKRKNLRYPYISVLLLLGALFFSSIPAEASSGGFLEGYETEEGQMKLFCDIPENGEAAAEETQFAVTLSSQELPALGITTAGEEHTPMTFYCLVDVSGSMGQEQMDQAKAVLTAISQGMNENDNMVISSLGNQLSDSGFLSDKNAINAEIQNLQIGNEDTNLYAGIVKSIDILKTDIRVNPKKCLLILSDGQDDQKSGITQSEAEQAVLDSSIPIYTVATLPSDPSGGQQFCKDIGGWNPLRTGCGWYRCIIGWTGHFAKREELCGSDAGYFAGRCGGKGYSAFTGNLYGKRPDCPRRYDGDFFRRPEDCGGAGYGRRCRTRIGT